MSTPDREALFKKIRGLLRQAENTPYEDEAITFLEKAQQMMMVHIISEEELWASEPSSRPVPIIRTIQFTGGKTGAQFKRVILNGVARANRCRMWYTSGNTDEAEVAGFESDVVFCEMLFTSISVQMNFLLARGLARNSIQEPPVHPKTFRINFMDAYATTIYHRLTESAERDTQESTGTDLVLARSAAVDRFVETQVGRLKRSSISRSYRYSSSAQVAGTSAAKETDLTTGGGGLGRTKRKELNG